jgi:hypothetical protein
MIKDLFEKSVLIFGCGNILWGDDGFGPAVIQRLKERYRLPADVMASDRPGFTSSGMNSTWATMILMSIRLCSLSS